VGINKIFFVKKDMCLIYYFIAGIKIHLEQSKQKVELVALEQMADVLGI